MERKELDISAELIQMMFNLFSEQYTNKQKINLLLKDLNDILKTDVGILSNIKDSKYEIVAASSVYNSGDIFELKNTYCNLVSETKKMHSITNIGKSDCVLKKHPLYIERKIETYIACPVFINDEFYGTVNFSGTKIREEFTEKDIALMRLITDRIEVLIERESNE